MTVALLGDGDRVAAVATGLGAMDVDVAHVALDAVEPDESVVAVAGGGLDLERVSDRLEGAWYGIELGHLGGSTIEGITGAITGFGADGPCYRCLRARVGATTNRDPAPSGPTDDVTARFAGAVAGWHLTDAGRRSALIGHVHQLDGTRRDLLPVPGCDCHPKIDRRSFTFDHRSRPVDAVLEAMEVALDDVVGVVTDVGERASTPAPYYLATLADTGGFSDVSAADQAAGVDRDWSAAFVRAMGEALERYCAGTFRTDALTTDPEAPTVGLDAFALAGEDVDPIGQWWPARTLDGDPVAIPADVVTFPTPPDAALPSITTGLGLGSSLVEATVRGVLEVIERDACMIAWYSTFEPAALASDAAAISAWRRRLLGEGLAVSLRLVTQDVDVPIVMGIVHRRDGDGDAVYTVPGVDPDDWPSFAVGSAAALDPVEAAERAIAEAVQNWMELEAMGRERAAEEQENIARFASFPREARDALAFDHRLPLSAVGPEDVPEGEAALDALGDRLAAADLEPYVARTTTPDVASLGLEAVRVVIPAAQPLLHGSAPMGDRLRSVPRELGYRPRLDRRPHPYP